MVSFQYRLVALDLDGTLLNSDKKVSENTKNVLMYLQQHHPDVEIVLASGRAPYLVIPTETDCGVDCSLIGYNGGLCLSKKAEGRTTIFEKAIPADRLIDIYKYVEDNNLYLNVYGDGIVYGVKRQIEKANNYSTMTGAKYSFVDSYFELKPELNPMKCLIITESEEECDRLLETLTPIFSDLSLVKSNCFSKTCKQYYVEFLKNGVNKGLSVREFCNLKSIPVEQMVAFGDAENDIDMLKIAGLGICLGNGNDATKAHSDKVSSYTNDQDGVARELVELYNLPKDLIK
ncbi:HAD superfamily hydrolase-like protein [Heterostelium album PN500]|uniref:HAD superfamily hydrolase-like protein n=1 Tax=Heterostelium pallidum (strain ATCC 26659 / Pp 5 / PN500) TaxID=670386 RepID=D3B604_HETP5|nr:HAD superfamily hydrolase-like protein [Heterostelium album PN500]EFA83302.1 HAD superfamily hydrolase-like protein [Heterostelium album PN500]|eukprot:XP_020435419.1 HAD superfamily hydrolase-like protein [Heterostelium album PN500]